MRPFAHEVRFLRYAGRPTVRGVCCAATARQVEHWLSTVDDMPLEIDLQGVTAIDRAALGVFLAVRRTRGHLRIVNPSPVVLRLLEATGNYHYLVRHHFGGPTAFLCG